MWIYNLIPHMENNMMSPLKKLAPQLKNALDRIKRFDCRVFVKIHLNASKFSEKALKTILVSFTGTGYILCHPESGKFMISRYLTFNDKFVHKDIYKTNEKCECHLDDTKSDPDDKIEGHLVAIEENLKK